MKPLVERWESWSPWRQMALAFPLIALVLVVLHLALFPHLTIGRVVGYAIMEGVPLTGLVLLATATEVARKRNAAAESHEGAAHDDRSSHGDPHSR